MAQSFLSPLQPFTLESLVASEQWSAVQAPVRKKSSVKSEAVRQRRRESDSEALKQTKTEL